MSFANLETSVPKPFIYKVKKSHEDMNNIVIILIFA